MKTSRRGLFGLIAGALASPYLPPPIRTVLGSASGSVTTYYQVGIREDLSDAIYSNSPMDTPFLSAMPVQTRLALIEWQKDTLV